MALKLGINTNVDTHNPDYLNTLEERYNLPIKAFSLNEKKDESLIKVYQATVREFDALHAKLTHGGNLFV